MSSAVKDAAHSSTSPQSELQRLFECPICVQIFRNPKLLPCGHSICYECCEQLSRDRPALVCPVCRRPSSTSAYSLPTNFGLRDLVQHHLESLESKKFACSSCQRRMTNDDCWSCEPCHHLVCSLCAIKSHQNHSLKAIDELLRNKEAKLAEWRQKLAPIDGAASATRRQIEANQARLIQCTQHLVKFTVWKKLTPELDAETRVLKQELTNIQKRYHDVSAARLISDESSDASANCDFTALPSDFKSLAQKQEKLMKRQRDAIAALRDCESKLTALLAPPTIGADSSTTAARREVTNGPQSNATGNAQSNANNAQLMANGGAQLIENDLNSANTFLRWGRRGGFGQSFLYDQSRRPVRAGLFGSPTSSPGNARTTDRAFNNLLSQSSDDDDVRLDVEDGPSRFFNRPTTTTNQRRSLPSEIQIDSDHELTESDAAHRLLNMVERRMLAENDLEIDAAVDDGGGGGGTASNDEMDVASNASIEAINGDGSALRAAPAPPLAAPRRPTASHKRCRGAGRALAPVGATTSAPGATTSTGWSTRSAGAASTVACDGNTSAASFPSSDDDDDDSDEEDCVGGGRNGDDRAIGSTIRFRVLGRH